MINHVTRGNICDDAKNTITHGRNDIYGRPENSFPIIAEGWTWILRARGVLAENQEVTAVDVAQMMCLLKIARGINQVYHPDNFVDQVGFAAIAGELAAIHQEEMDEKSKKEACNLRDGL